MHTEPHKDRIALLVLYNHRSFPLHMFHSLLEDNGYDVRSYYLRRQYDRQRANARELAFLADQVAQHNPALFCVSLTSGHFKLAAEITEAVRARIPTTVLWGGIHPTVMPEECLEHADAICRGEGEDALLEMAQAVRDGGSYEGIANLWVKRNGAVIRNEPRMLRTDLDSLPWPRFVAPNRIYLDKDGIVDYERGRNRVTTYDILTTRGCPHSCSYCCNEFLNEFFKGKGPIVRRRSVDNVIAELRDALEMFPNLLLVIMGDDLFSLNVPWLREFAEKYPGAIGLPFVCNLHPNHLDEERMGLLKRAGLRFGVMGIQSGSVSSREEVLNRHTSQENVIRATELIHEYGVRPLYQFIIDNPLESDEQRAETRVLISQLRKPFLIQLFHLTWFPGTRITERALEEKVISPSDVEHVREGYHTLFMADVLSYFRTAEELYWDCSYFLAAKLPGRVVEWLVRQPFFRRHIKFIRWLLRRLPLDYHRHCWLMVNTALNILLYRMHFYLDVIRDRKFRYLRRIIADLVRRDHPPVF
jgi:radical SAM superfamily enzyme YgiQ (UPF0313 family)